VDGAGSVLVTDYEGHALRQIDIATGAVRTLAGGGAPGAADGVGAAAAFNAPTGVAVTADGATALVADSENHALRRVDLATGEVRVMMTSSVAPYSLHTAY
jgi:sugar lactone lactonase YvrE